MNRRGVIGIMLVASALLLVASCASKKKLTPPPAPEATYQWVTAKMDMDIAAPGLEYHNVSGILRMRRDSTIWISASAMMGIEAVRTRITCDSVILLNRLDGSYLAEPLDTVMAKLQLPLTLHESQTLLLGKGGSEPVELQFGPYTAKIRYSDIHWDEPTTFPIKINSRYERRKL